ncbi:uncharacterized protein EMH_0088260 [Eimeria mitis]|uniref:Uncharacterized protein n=1 Tax=Eimeria mitis TaxID=44415 RepID=U6KD39_9EIME|nr:uncharacterized protein EMH_0088260 [Eimeria mitis]CDJ34172.1 hypothetical protein EMH_0088260 [Eimeria mitis]
MSSSKVSAAAAVASVSPACVDVVAAAAAAAGAAAAAAAAAADTQQIAASLQEAGSRITRGRERGEGTEGQKKRPSSSEAKAELRRHLKQQQKETHEAPHKLSSSSNRQTAT